MACHNKKGQIEFYLYGKFCPKIVPSTSPNARQKIVYFVLFSGEYDFVSWPVYNLKSTHIRGGSVEPFDFDDDGTPPCLQPRWRRSSRPDRPPETSPTVPGIRRERAPRHGIHQGIPIPRPLCHNAMNCMGMVGPEGLEPSTKGYSFCTLYLSFIRTASTSQGAPCRTALAVEPSSLCMPSRPWLPITMRFVSSSLAKRRISRRVLP